MKESITQDQEAEFNRSRAAVESTAKAESRRQKRLIASPYENLSSDNPIEKADEMIDLIHERALQEDLVRSLKDYKELELDENGAIKGPFKGKRIKLYLDSYGICQGYVGERMIDRNGKLDSVDMRKVWDKLEEKFNKLKEAQKLTSMYDSKDKDSVNAIIEEILS